MRGALALWLLLCAQGARAGEPDARVAVVIGNNLGDRGDQPLEYAEADAARFHQMLIDAGAVAPQRASLVTGDAAAVRRALAQAQGRLEELRAKSRTALIVYVSAHADEEALHLEGTHLPLSELIAAATAAAADLRVVIVDACRTRAVGRPKGGRPVPEVAVQLATEQAQGLVLISASGEGEPAQEWPYLHGSLFTHHLLAGLRGLADLNQDGRVSLLEAYGYSYSRTALDSASGGHGLQRPSYDFQLSGFGEWGLTWPAQLGAALTLAPGFSGQFFIATDQSELVTAVDHPGGRATRVALRPGRYRVVRQDGRFADVAEVHVPFGGERALAASDFVRVPARRALLRGGEPLVLRPWRLGVAYGLGTASVPGASAEHGPELLLSYAWRTGWVRLRGGLGFNSLRTANARIDSQLFEAGLGIAYVAPVSALLLHAGAEAQYAYVSQRVHRDDAAEVERILGIHEPARAAALWGGGLFVGATLLVDARWSIGLELEGSLRRTPLWDQAVVWTPRAQARLGASFAF